MIPAPAFLSRISGFCATVAALLCVLPGIVAASANRPVPSLRGTRACEMTAWSVRLRRMQICCLSWGFLSCSRCFPLWRRYC